MKKYNNLQREFLVKRIPDNLTGNIFPFSDGYLQVKTEIKTIVVQILYRKRMFLRDKNFYTGIFYVRINISKKMWISPMKMVLLG